MKCSIFEGSAAAVVMPMDEHGNLDLDIMGELLGQLFEEKTNITVVDGTTGESTTLDDNEKMEVTGFVIRHVSGRVLAIAGTGSSCTEHVVKLSRKAEKLEANAPPQVTSYYNKASQEGLVRRFIWVGDHVGIPMILYNVSNRTGVTIQPETYRILSKHPGIGRTKEAGGNMSMVAKTAALYGDGFSICSGNDDQTIPIMALGGKGVISVLVNTMPRQTHDMCRLPLEGELEENREMQLYPLDIIEVLFWDVNPIPVKTVLLIAGMRMDSCRLPLTPMRVGEKAKPEAVMKRYR